MIGNEEDFTAASGFEVEGAGRTPLADRRRRLQADDRRGGEGITRTSRSWPRRCATPRPPRVNDWGAVCCAGGQFYEAPNAPGPGNLRPRGRRRQLRQRADLWVPGRQGPTEQRRLRRGPRRAGHDHARRHVDGHVKEVEAIMKGGRPRDPLIPA